MTRPALLALAVIAAAPAAAALAQTSSTATPMSGVTVVAPAKEPPKVVATFPQSGKSVAPGALILKVTFDQKMAPDGWDYDKASERYPACLDRPRLLKDEKTFVLLCTVGPETRFGVAFNRSSEGGFQNLAGQRAAGAEMDFSTSAGPALATIEDAMKAAGLKADEGPVMDIKGNAALASAAAPTPSP